VHSEARDPARPHGTTVLSVSTLLEKLKRKAAAGLASAPLHYRNLTATGSIVSGPGGVVSLTSYGKRVKQVHLTIESIARGTVRPSRIILWLDPEVFAEPPKPLLRLKRRGLEIRVSMADWGPHKKYFPYCAEFADRDLVLVTADDDVIYPDRWLEDLSGAVQRCPDAIWAHRVRRVALSPDGLSLAPYATWEDGRDGDPSIANTPIGVSGVAYPPSFQRIMREAGTAFMRHCARADDLWLHLHAVRAGMPVGQVRDRAGHFLPLLGSQGNALALENQIGGKNDKVASALYDSSDVQAIRGALSGIDS
jgi:hypothetical protein